MCRNALRRNLKTLPRCVCIDYCITVQFNAISWMFVSCSSHDIRGTVKQSCLPRSFSPCSNISDGIARISLPFSVATQSLTQGVIVWYLGHTTRAAAFACVSRALRPHIWTQFVLQILCKTIVFLF